MVTRLNQKVTTKHGYRRRGGPAFPEDGQALPSEFISCGYSLRSIAHLPLRTQTAKALPFGLKQPHITAQFAR